MAADSPEFLARLFAGPFPALEEALLSSLPARLAAAREREYVLLVPSNDLREHLLRRLAARGDLAAAGVSFLTLYDFAVRLLKHRGLFPRELPPALFEAALSAAVGEVYAAGVGDFAAIRKTPGFPPALARTLADLEEGWIGERELFEASRRARARGDAARAARWGEWRRLFLAVERKVAALGGMSRRRIFQEAVAGFEQPGYPFRVTLYGFYDFTRLQWTLVEALLDSGLLEEVYFPALFGGGGRLAPAFAYAAGAWERLVRAFEGNVEIVTDSVPEPLGEVRGRLFSAQRRGALRPAPLRILSAPHEEGEWRQAARTVREWRDARPGEEVVVVARQLEETGASAWERMAAEYGVPAAERLSVPLAAVPPVRTLLLMIRAALEDFPRAPVIEILSSPFRRLGCAQSGPPPRPELWDVMTRELLVVSGNDWDRRLVASRARLRGEEDGGEEGKADSERSVQLHLLREEFRALRAALLDLRAAENHAELAERLVSIVRDEFVMFDDDTPEAERDRRALAALLALLEDVGGIPERVVPWPGADAALERLEALIRGRRIFAGRRAGMREPGTVIAGDLVSLRGVTADRILFLSANEDLVPAQLDEDPLLSDEDRAEMNQVVRRPHLPDALSLRRRNAAEEKLLFSLPAASARREVAFGVLRSDASGAERRPSRYLLDLLSGFAGPEVFSADWARVCGARIDSLPRAPFAAQDGEGVRSGRERALAAWRRGAVPARDVGVPWRRAAGTLAALRDRAAGDGLFPARIPVPAARRAATATALDDLARCPYRYFLMYLVGLSPVEEPEDVLSLSPAEEGAIAHEILAELGRRASEGAGWEDPGLAARRIFDRFARENPTGLPGLFRILCGTIERDVSALVEWERERAAANGGRRVEAVERPFEIPAARRRPALRGRVDRIDRTADGGVEVIDYKYRDGKRERPPLDLIAAGLSNQVPVYLEYARSLAPGPRSVSASLLFLRDGIRRVAVGEEGWKAVREEWERALSRWLALAAAGIFPPLPHNRFAFAGAAPPRYCDSCAFCDHCRVSPAFDGADREADALVSRVAGEEPLRAIADFRPARTE